MSKIYLVMGLVPYESQAPIAAFAAQDAAEAMCAKLKAKRERYLDANDRFFTKVNELSLTMPLDDAWKLAGKEPKTPEHDYDEFYVAEVPMM